MKYMLQLYQNLVRFCALIPISYINMEIKLKPLNLMYYKLLVFYIPF